MQILIIVRIHSIFLSSSSLVTSQISIMVNIMDQVQLNLLQHQSTTQKAKKFFIIFLIILFILIITVIISILTVLERHTPQSQSSIQTITAACRATQYYYPCITSMSSLHKTYKPSSSSKIDASYIFGLSIQAAYFQFYNISVLPENLTSRFENKDIEPPLRHCQNMFNNSLTHLHKSRILTKNFQGPNGKILADEELVKLRILIERAIYDTQSCVDELEAKVIQWRIVKTTVIGRIDRIFMAKACMLNSLAILENQYGIEKMINPGLHNIFASILSREHYIFVRFTVLGLDISVLLSSHVSMSRP